MNSLELTSMVTAAANAVAFSFLRLKLTFSKIRWQALTAYKK